MINDPVVVGMIHIAKSLGWLFWLYVIVGLALLERWEKNEKKRVEAAIKRQNARKTYKSTSDF